MKKRILSIFAIIALILGIAGIAVACGEGNVEKADYSVTVLYENDDPVPGVTVSWISGGKTAGNAQTNADGTATASLPVGSYAVELSGYGDGYAYTPISVSSSMRDVFMTLSVNEVTYTVTVLDKSGNPAANVGVNWTNASGATVGTATTDTSGQASTKLAYGNYTVTLATSTLPEGNTTSGPKNVTGRNPSATFNLISNEGAKTYSVTVRSEGGLLFAQRRFDENGVLVTEGGELKPSNSVSLLVYKGTNLLDAGTTDEYGTFTFSAEPATYTVRVALVPNGYTYEPVTLTDSKFEDVIIMRSSVITSDPAADTTYTIGDIIHDYTFTTPFEIDGEIWSKSISDLLYKEGKEAIFINNWGINCSWCMKEMPYMEEAYQEYKDKIEIIGVNNYSNYPDSDDAIRSWSTATNPEGFSFPMMRDVNGFVDKFGITGWPATIVIDRYGAIAHFESGAVTSVAGWKRLIEKFIGDDYEQTFIPGIAGESVNIERPKPEIDLADNHYEMLGEVLNDTVSFEEAGATITWYPETGDGWEYAWPFLYGSPSDVGVSGNPEDKIVYASNSHVDNAVAILYADVTMNKGKVLTFDYYVDTEEGYDVLSIVWDGRLIKEISGDSGGWQTCYLYFELLDADLSGTHVLAFAYVKDDNDDGYYGDDVVCIKNVRFVDASVLEELNQPFDMLRSAGYGIITQEGHFSYYANVELKEDGYYHVILDELEGKDLAGNDKSPLLFVNLLSPTPWNVKYSLVNLMGGVDENTGDYMYDTVFTINGVTRDYRLDLYEYCEAAQASYVQYCVPVDAFLHDLLVEFMARVSGEYTHEKEWLEVCYYYSHYGTGDPVGNPILGVMDRTAIEIELDESGNSGRVNADITRDVLPFPIVRYKFTPKKAGVYLFKSYVSDADAANYAAQMWLYDASCADLDHGFVYDGNFRRHFKNENDQNFVTYYYLEADHEYYLAVAFQTPMLQIGKYDFEILYQGETTTELAPCSEDIYTMILDDDGNMIGEQLLGAVNYKLNEADGYYYVVNADGELGSKIYLDTQYSSTSMLYVSLSFLLDKSVNNPDLDSEPLYKYFDFTQCTVYHSSYDADGDEFVTVTPRVDLSSVNRDRFKDYTEILHTYFTKSYDDPNAKDGLIPVNEEIATALSLFYSMRVDPIYCASNQPAAVAAVVNKTAAGNDWLRFCWYYKTHDANNP